MDCFMCKSGRGAVELVRCNDDDEVAMVCRVCAEANADELSEAERRFWEEHLCPGHEVAFVLARRSMREGLAELHVARVHLQQASETTFAEEMSARLRELEELYGRVKAAIAQPRTA